MRVVAAADLHYNELTAGRLREDYGKLFPAEKTPTPIKLHKDASRVILSGFAAFDLSGTTGRPPFSPATGLRWKTRDGEAFLEAEYEMDRYRGGGTRGLRRVIMSATVIAP